MHWCTIGGNENICRLLLDHNADVNIQDKDGRTPLHWCAREGNENLCRLLLEHNADVNIQEKHGFTALHWCAFRGYENLFRLLLERNADVNIQDKDGSTPLHLSARRNRDCSMIIDLLVKYGVQNLNIHDAEGLTLLQLAVRHGNSQAVKKLVDLGADVSVVTADEKDARRLEILKNKAEREKQHLKFEMSFRQKTNETENEPGVSSVPSTGKLTEAYLKSKKTLRQSSSYTHYNKGNRGRTGRSTTVDSCKREPQVKGLVHPQANQ